MSTNLTIESWKYALDVENAKDRLKAAAAAAVLVHEEVAVDFTFSPETQPVLVEQKIAV